MSQKYQYDINSCNAWKEVFEIALLRDVEIYDFARQFLSSSIAEKDKEYWKEKHHRELYENLIFMAENGEFFLKITPFNQEEWLSEMGFLYAMMKEVTHLSPKELLQKIPPREMSRYAKDLENWAYDTVLENILMENEILIA